MDSDFHARPRLDRLLVPLGGDSVQTSVKFLSPVCGEKVAEGRVRGPLPTEIKLAPSATGTYGIMRSPNRAMSRAALVPLPGVLSISMSPPCSRTI